MTPAQIAEDYRKNLLEYGETVTFRRYTDATLTTHTDVDVIARVIEYTPEQLIGPIQQGDRKIIALAKPFTDAGWPLPIRSGSAADRVIVRGKTMTVQAVDDSTRRVSGVLMAYEIRVRG